MPTKMIAVLLAVSACTQVHAAAQDLSLLTEPPPKTARVGEAVAFTAAGGYHFNLKAPQKCGDSEAFEISTATLKCRFTAAGEQAVSLMICDDRETRCMQQDFTILAEGAGLRPAGAAELAPKDTGLEGFLLNEPGAALAQAKKEHKLLFIDFFGRWCPPCRVMEDTVLTQAAFLDATRDMVRVSLDVDRPAAREWRSRFKANSYPTYLIADADLGEIGRWSGSGNLPAFSAWVRDQERWKDLPIEKAEAETAELDEAGRLRVAKEYLGAEKWTEARKALAGLDTRAAAYLDAQAQARETNSTDTVKMSELYRGLIARFDGQDGLEAEGSVLDWIAELQKLDAAAAKPYIEGLDALIARLDASKGAADEGYTPADVLYQAAYDMEDAGLAALAKGLYARAAQAYADQAGAAARPELAKGLRMSQARCLMGAGRVQDAAAVYGGLTEKFPGEYAFHRSYANALLELKKYPEAQAEADLAARLSYGDIHSGIVILKAKIELARKDKAGAVKTLSDALAELEDAGAGAGGSSRQLKEFLKKAQASE